MPSKCLIIIIFFFRSHVYVFLLHASLYSTTVPLESVVAVNNKVHSGPLPLEFERIKQMAGSLSHIALETKRDDEDDRLEL